MGDIVEFNPPEETEDYLVGEAVCTKCRHTWAAAAPVGTGDLWCPKCNLDRGAFRFNSYPKEGTPVWNCDCGNDLFHVSDDGVFCIGCGSWQ